MKRQVSIRIEVELEADDQDIEAAIADLVAAARRAVEAHATILHAAAVRRRGSK